MLNVIELFGGIGACTAALKRLGVNFDVIDYVDNDVHAVASYNAIHNHSFDPKDVSGYTPVRELTMNMPGWPGMPVYQPRIYPVDLIMHGSPCQDFSVAGKQAGGDEGSGTRSSLMYETLRIVDIYRPKYVIWENVKNVLSAKHRHNFENYLEQMELLNYENHYQVLNAKDYNIPQNRERLFVVSIQKDYHQDFHFPEPLPRTIGLSDLLETNPDESLYLSEKTLKAYTKKTPVGLTEESVSYKPSKPRTKEMSPTQLQQEQENVRPTTLSSSHQLLLRRGGEEKAINSI